MKRNKSEKRRLLFGIRDKIFICFFVPIIFMIVVGTMAYQKAAEGMREKFQETTTQTLEMATQYIEMSGKFIETEATRYAFDPTLGKYYLGILEGDQFARADVVKSTKSNMMAARATNPFISNIHLITDSSVEMLTTYTLPTKQVGQNTKQVGNLAEYREQMSSDGKKLQKWVDYHEVLDTYLSLNESDYIMSYQMLSEQKSACVVIDVKPSAIEDFLKELDLGEGSVVGLVTENGREIICWHQEEGEIELLSEDGNLFYGKDFYKAIDEAEEASGVYEVKASGKDYLFLYNRSDVNKATICALVPSHIVTGQAESIKNLTYTLVILAAIIAGIIGFGIAASIQKNMKKISKSFGEVSKGDLTVRVVASSKDEFKGLADSATNMIYKNKKLVTKVSGATAQLEESAREVKEASEIISGYSEEISKRIGGINEGMARQSSHAQECVSRTNSLSDEIKDVSGIVKRVELLVGEAEMMIGKGMSMVQVLGERARETTDVTSRVGKSIEVLKDESTSINQFVATIAEISDQTNLLSLNASIEAARAGDAGKGFGVVAEEIRKLADDSAKAAGEIKSNVDNITKQTKDSVENARKAEEMVALQTQAVGEVITVFREMSERMSKLIEGLKEIAVSTEKAGDKRKGTIESVRNISGIIEDTAESTGMVNDIIVKLTNNVENLNRISEALDLNMGELKTEISVFKTE